MESNPIKSEPNQLLATPQQSTIALTPDQIKASLQLGLKPKNSQLDLLINFSPRTISFNEFN